MHATFCCFLTLSTLLAVVRCLLACAYSIFCMVLYGMRRPCVTVDRHVARGCRLKGWVDTDDTDAISYRLMCDVPAGLMYDLSLLLLEGVKDGGEGPERAAAADTIVSAAAVTRSKKRKL